MDELDDQFFTAPDAGISQSDFADELSECGITESVEFSADLQDAGLRKTKSPNLVQD